MNQINVQKSSIRCPYCHDTVISGKIFGCDCGAMYHIDCCKELAKCASCNSTKNFTGEPTISVDPKESIFNVSAFLSAIKKYPKYNVVKALVSANSKNPLFLTGGRVYRTLLALSENKEPVLPDSCDWDFLCYKTTWFTHFPKECEEEFTVTKYHRYDGKAYKETEIRNPFLFSKNNHCYRFTSSSVSIDLMTANRVVRDKSLPNDITGYLRAVPLNIQSIAFDLTNSKFHYTSVFMEAFQKRRLEVNHSKILIDHCHYKNISVEEFMAQKAASLNFTYVYDNRSVIVK